MRISGINGTHIDSATNITHDVSGYHRILIIQTPDCSLSQISKLIVTDRNVLIWSVKHHTVTADSCKYILKSVILYHDILTDTSIIWKISWKNLRHTGIQLNTFLTAAFIIFPVASECTSCDFCILYARKLQKMGFEIVKKCSILYCDICSMSYSETYKTTRFFFVFHRFIVCIPDTAIDCYIAISIIPAF